MPCGFVGFIRDRSGANYVSKAARRFEQVGESELAKEVRECKKEISSPASATKTHGYWVRF
jgi:hypothetical protein